MSRVILVSNRLPFQFSSEGGECAVTRSAGGLVAGLGRLHEQGEGFWVGTMGSGGSSSAKADEVLFQQRLVSVALNVDDARRHYEGYSNGVLWPLFHYLLDRINYVSKDFGAYARVNEQFADAVARIYRPGDLIWVHDYHLMLLPSRLRDRLPQAPIGFFLHIPFPSSEVFRILPRKEEILRGLLGANVIGVHTYDYGRHLVSSFRRILGVEFDEDWVRMEDGRCHVGVFPLGVDVAMLSALARAPATQARAERLRQQFAGRKVILGVDRMDYTKGIPLRLSAFRHLLKNDRCWREKVCLVQLAVPSRSDIPSYRSLKEEVERKVGEIDGKFEAEGLTPIHYMYRSVPPEELAALYRLADVMWVTPIRDGMNLVAKEYVSSRVDNTGVLILSEFAGAASEMGEALLVNPWDIEGSALILDRALRMQSEEMGRRMAALRKRVETHDVERWVERSLGELAKASQEKSYTTGGARTGKRVPAGSDEWIAQLRKEFARASRALLALDYDGTLVEMTPTPGEASPTAELLRLLGALSDDPQRELVVISGRDATTLATWFPSLNASLVAEHGFCWRRRGKTAWQKLLPKADLSWKASVRQVLEEYAARCPGAIVEEKSAALVWHYRQVEPAYGNWQARELAQHLSEAFSQSPVEVLHGAKIVEVRPQGFNKGRALKLLVDLLGGFDFVLVAGDDRTDEDMFVAVPDDAWAIKVGRSATHARFRVYTPGAFRELLAGLATAEPDRMARPLPA